MYPNNDVNYGADPDEDEAGTDPHKEIPMSDWYLSHEAPDLFILGPGRLQIRIRDYDPRNFFPSDPDPEHLGPNMIEQVTNYEIEEGVILQVLSHVDRTTNAGSHRLFLGRSVRWEIDGEFAARIHALGWEADATSKTGVH